MNQRHCFLALLATASLTLAGNAFASGSETRAVTAKFNAIELEGPMSLRVSQGDTNGVRIDGVDGDRAKVVVEIRNGNLHIGWKDKQWFGRSPQSNVQITLAVPVLNQLALSGSGDIALESFVQPDQETRISVGGSGDVSAKEIRVKSLSVSIAGSGEVNIAAGAADGQSVSIAGSGDYVAPRLATRNAQVSIAGSGDVDLAASDALEISIAGSGDVRYHGTPRVSKSIIGSGDVTQAR